MAIKVTCGKFETTVNSAEELKAIMSIMDRSNIVIIEVGQLKMRFNCKDLESHIVEDNQNQK